MANYESGEGLFEEENLNAMMIVIENDLVSFGEAMKNKKWKEAMSVEIKGIERNQPWELTVLPKGVKPIGVKWVFKTKLNEDGDVEKFKAILVAKGYAQWHGIDYIEVFAPMAILDIICVILAMVAQLCWEVFQLNVKSAFLHGELKEKMFVQQPGGFIKKGEERIRKRGEVSPILINLCRKESKRIRKEEKREKERKEKMKKRKNGK